MIGRLRNRLSETLRQLSLPVWLLEGAEKHSHEKFSVVYAGVERHMNYFCRLAFENPPAVKLLGKYPVWDLRGRLRKDLGQALSVVEVSRSLERFYPAKEGRPRIPVWVWSARDLGGNRAEVETGSRFRTHRQRVRQHDLVYRVWKDEKDLKDFYENMYLPYAAFRHSDSTFTYSYEEVRKKFQAGQLSGVEIAGVPILSQVTALDGKNAHAFILGVRKGQEEYLKKGIIEAFNYLCILQLMDAGCGRLDLGYSRGFLNDGVLRNKFRLGARLTGLIHEESGCLDYEVREWTGALKSFLANNPAVLLEKGKLWAGYFQTGESALDSAQPPRPEAELREDGFEGTKMIYYKESSKSLEMRNP